MTSVKRIYRVIRGGKVHLAADQWETIRLDKKKKLNWSAFPTIFEDVTKGTRKKGLPKKKISPNDEVNIPAPISVPELTPSIDKNVPAPTPQLPVVASQEQNVCQPVLVILPISATQNIPVTTNLPTSARENLPVLIAKQNVPLTVPLPDENDLRRMRPVERTKARELLCCGGKCRKCRDKSAILLRQNKQLRLEIKTLKRENAKLKKETDPDRKNKKRKLVEDIYGSRAHPPCRIGYPPQLLNDTLRLKRISKEAYLFVKNQFHLPLPSETSLRRYVTKMNTLVKDDNVSSVNGQMPQEADGTGLDTLNFDPSSNSVPHEETDSIPAPVQTVMVVCEDSVGEEMPLEVALEETDSDVSVSEVETVEVFASDVCSYGQMPLETSIDQTCNVFWTSEYGNS